MAEYCPVCGAEVWEGFNLPEILIIVIGQYPFTPDEGWVWELYNGKNQCPEVKGVLNCNKEIVVNEANALAKLIPNAKVEIRGFV